MTDDERFQRDVTLGKRIGLYKFRGELGTGNFSRVKLAFHQLAHGKRSLSPMMNDRPHLFHSFIPDTHFCQFRNFFDSACLPDGIDR